MALLSTSKLLMRWRTPCRDKLIAVAPADVKATYMLV